MTRKKTNANILNLFSSASHEMNKAIKNNLDHKNKEHHSANWSL